MGSFHSTCGITRGQPRQVVLVKAQHLADIARGGAAAIGNHIGGHGGAQLAIALIDILNGLFALVAAGQIEIDIRPFAALLRKKALEQQIHRHRIHRGDSQRIAHRAVGRRAAALHQNALLAAELHDVPDDQEIARQLELFNQRQLALNLLARLVAIGPITIARAFIGTLAQE